MELVLLGIFLILLVVWFIKSLTGGKNSSSSSASSSGKKKQQGKASSTFFRIPDQYHSLEEITNALRKAGLESCQLILAVDFTKSNTYSGQRTFNGKNLHTINSSNRALANPYEKCIYIIGKTLASFDDDQLIPCFGFGDLTTKGHGVFPFDSRLCYGFEEVRKMIVFFNALLVFRCWRNTGRLQIVLYCLDQLISHQLFTRL